MCSTKILFVSVIIIFIYLYKQKNISQENLANKHMHNMGNSNPCTDKLSDLEYLEHMIPHQQVAIDMSRRLLLHTNNSYLLEFCRNLIIDQQREILYMNNLLNKKNYLYKSELL